MDVRCEKCLTVYELDDAKVGEQGLTVKCQECGNLFKVRRRVDTAEMVAKGDDEGEAPTDPLKTEAVAQRPGRTTPHPTASEPGAAPSGPDATTAGALGRTRRISPPPAAAPERPEERAWLLRSAASGEISRFRELTTLQQWIVERKVTRQDEISRGGESWKPLGGIAELASFFHVVEQAQAVADASQPALAVRRGAVEELDLPNMPTELLGAQRRGVEANTLGVGEHALSDEADEMRPERRSGGGLVGFTIVVLLLGGVGVGGFFGYRYFRAHAASSAPASSDTRDAVARLVEHGHASLRSDTDDGFREAISSLDRAIELDPSSIPARVDLAEAHITWADYLLEDAHALESGGSAADTHAARTLRTDAQSHLERARRVLEEPTGEEAAASPALARAFGDLLRVEGAPSAAAEQYLQRAAQKGSGDPALAYTLGVLELREGHKPEALVHFTEAVRHDGEDGDVPLVRAHYRLAVLAREAGRKDDLRKECETILRASPKHDRARALCTSDAAPDLGSGAKAPDGAVAAVDKTLAPPALPRPPHEAQLAPPASNDYPTLIREADHLSQSGRSAQARKLYEHALELDPKGVAALTGLGYCDLDAERFLQSADRFNAVLQIDPNNGDAMIGLAEGYKVRGMNDRAADLYRKYLAADPSGGKAQMARQNLREIEHATGITIPPSDVTDKQPDDAPKDEPVSQTPPDEPPP